MYPNCREHFSLSLDIHKFELELKIGSNCLKINKRTGKKV